MAAGFDVIIAGLGAMGSAACYHLAKRGKKVLGIDQFHPPHTFGSSHGQTRIIREAYFEDPIYVPLVQHAYRLWDELERESGRQLFVQTGGLMIGAPDGVVVAGATRSAERHRLAHEVLSADEVRRRFPAFQPEEWMSAVWEPRAGILFPESCIDAHLEGAKRSGATIVAGERIHRWTAGNGRVQVSTGNGTHEAGQLIATAGAWMPKLFPELTLPLKVERQILMWFDPSDHPEWFDRERCPVYLWEYAANRFFYGFPNLGYGVKVARHHEGESADPDGVRRDVASAEIDWMRGIVGRFLPSANGQFRSATVCLYTNMPDGHFLIDRHPERREVLIASPCSGHGFKFSSAIGSVLADLVCDGTSAVDLSLFALSSNRGLQSP